MSLNPNALFSDERHFESEVRRMARLVWPQAKIDRSPILDGRERDVVVQNPDHNCPVNR